MDVVVVAAMVIGFALLATMHVTIAVGLSRRATKTRALIGFVVAPAAPWLAWQASMRVRAVLWVVAFVLYVAALVLGYRVK